MNLGKEKQGTLTLIDLSLCSGRSWLTKRSDVSQGHRALRNRRSEENSFSLGMTQR